MVHDSHIRSLEHFVYSDGIEWSYSIDRQEWRGHGRLDCAHGLFIAVNKLLETNHLGQVRTHHYGYHASHVAIAERSGGDDGHGSGIFRYDCSPHFMMLPHHHDKHHLHTYVIGDWVEQEPVLWIGHDHWPHLDTVILKLEEWWVEHSSTCGLPDLG